MRLNQPESWSPLDFQSRIDPLVARASALQLHRLPSPVFAIQLLLGDVEERSSPQCSAAQAVSRFRTPFIEEAYLLSDLRENAKEKIKQIENAIEQKGATV